MKRILHYIPAYRFGGIESLTYELNRELKDRYQFIYLVEVDLDDKLKEKLTGVNAKVIKIPHMTKDGIWKHLVAIKKVFQENNFDVLHVHDCDSRFFVMMMAKLYNVKKRIYHIHSKNISGKVIQKAIKRIGVRLNISLSTSCLACSIEAAKAKGAKKYQIVNNCIDLQKFRYDEEKRKAVRKKYSIPDKSIVLLFVGRLEKVKNTDYLIEILKTIPENIRNRYVLMIVGDGKETNRLKAHAKELEKTKVIFIGKKNNVSSYYSAADFLCLPSLAEGFSIVTLEAQASGLSCIVSSNVPKIINLNHRVSFIGIEKDDIKNWVKHVTTSTITSKEDRINDANIIIKKKYDSKSTARIISQIYEKEDK